MQRELSEATSTFVVTAFQRYCRSLLNFSKEIEIKVYKRSFFVKSVQVALYGCQCFEMGAANKCMPKRVEG